MAEDHLVYLAGLYPAPVEDTLYHRPRELFGLNVLKGSSDLTHRRAAGFHYYNIAHKQLLPLMVTGQLKTQPWTVLFVY
jgi:hypothetical protein